MLLVIVKSFSSLCQDFLKIQPKEGKSVDGEFYGAHIPFCHENIKYACYLFLKKDTLDHFSSALLGDSNLQENELSDLCKELSNLTLGQAKTFLEDENLKLSTPEYLGKTDRIRVELDQKSILKLKNRTLVIGIKKID